MPTGKVIASDSPVSDSVTGSLSATADSTVWLSTSEEPKSPCARWPSHSPSWASTGRSRPRLRRTAAIASGLACSPAITTAGSPGSSSISRKASTDTSSTTGTACAIL